MKYLEATDSNGTELYLFQLENNLFISIPKEQLEFKPLSPEEQREYDMLYESTYNPDDGSM